jgi:hypothetical protein
VVGNDQARNGRRRVRQGHTLLGTRGISLGVHVNGLRFRADPRTAVRGLNLGSRANREVS